MITNPAIGASDFLPQVTPPQGVNRAATRETADVSASPSAPAAAPVAPAEKSSPEQVEDAVKQIEQFTQTVAQNLKFSIDEDTGKTVVKIMDSQTNELIRQIPSEEAINISRALGDIKGMLFSDQA
ncbi:MAG: flagellar protein FlaG [Nitrosomonas sp.]|nr:flagellar protein FlaG [Nitrosomonas sp.]